MYSSASGNLSRYSCTLISSLRKLWKFKVANLSEEEIDSQRDTIKAAIHDKMMSVVEAELERQLIDDAHRKDLNEMERAWSYGTAIININTNGSHTINDVKGMDREYLLSLITTSKGGQREGDGIEGGTKKLSKIIGVKQPTVWGYIQCLYLEPKTQAMIGRGEKVGDSGQLPPGFGLNNFEQVKAITSLLTLR